MPQKSTIKCLIRTGLDFTRAPVTWSSYSLFKERCAFPAALELRKACIHEGNTLASDLRPARQQSLSNATTVVASAQVIQRLEA
jgi:hypothetical protein